jgi:hypothetical protein
MTKAQVIVPGLFAVQAGGRVAHHNPHHKDWPASGGLLLVVRGTGLLALRTLSADHVVERGGDVACRSSSEC